MWLTMVVLHAVAGLGAFACGVLAIDPRRRPAYPWALPALVGLLVAMTVFVVGAMAAHWSSLDSSAQAVFVGLVVLAAYMVWRAVHALRRAEPPSPADAVASIDDVGFVLISLFDGFVIVAAIDLGFPPWVIIPLAVAAVAFGHRAVQQVKRDAVRRAVTIG